MANDDSNMVLVRPLKIFLGQAGEGTGQDGLVMPDQKPFRITRQRLADLKANGLVEEASDSGPADPAPAEPEPTPVAPEAQAEDVKPARGRPARA